MRNRTFLAIFMVFVFMILSDTKIEAKNLLLADKNKSDYSDSLKVWSNFFSMTGYKYSYLGQKGDVGWGGSKVKVIVQDVPEARKEVNRFGTYHKSSIILYIVSGVALGWGLGAQLAGKDDDARPFLIAGAAGFAVAVPLDIIGYKHLKKGVKKFNEHQSGGK